MCKQGAMPFPIEGDPNSYVWNIQNIHMSGLGSKIYSNDAHTQITHYVRAEAVKLWGALESIIHEEKKIKILNVKGDPGAGKSTAVFGWLGYQQCKRKKKVFFVTQTESKTYNCTTLNDHPRVLDINDSASLFSEIKKSGAEIVVFDSFKDPVGGSHSSWAVNNLLTSVTSITIIVCSSLQAGGISMKRFASCDYFLREHFVCGWSDSDILACRQQARLHSNGMLQPELVVDDNTAFVRRLRLAGGNMRLMNTDDEEVRQLIDECIAQMDMRAILSGEVSSGQPSVVNTLFVHTSAKNLKLISAYAEDQVCEHVQLKQVKVAKLLDPKNSAFQGWLLEILMKVLFRNSRRRNTSITFYKRPRSYLPFPSRLRLTVDRIVSYGGEYMNSLKSQMYVNSGEKVVFLPERNNQGLFNSVAVIREREHFDVYFFQATVARTHRMLYIYGGIFLAHLFPTYLSGSVSDRVKTMRRGAAERERKMVEEEEEEVGEEEEPQSSRKCARVSTKEASKVTSGSSKRQSPRRIVSARTPPNPSGDVAPVLKPSGEDTPLLKLSAEEQDEDSWSVSATSTAMGNLSVGGRAVNVPDELSPLPSPGTGRVNTFKSLKLHFYIVAPQETYKEFDLEHSEQTDIEYMTQYDSSFTKDSVRVTYLKDG